MQQFKRIDDQTVTLQCIACKAEEEIPLTEEESQRVNTGELIQRVLPHLSAGQREILISGICGRCFDDLFEEED